jgi:hypothetical protein
VFQAIEVTCSQLLQREGRFGKGIRTTTRHVTFAVPIADLAHDQSIQIDCPHCKHRLEVQLSLRGNWGKMRQRRQRRGVGLAVCGAAGAIALAVVLGLHATKIRPFPRDLPQSPVEWLLFIAILSGIGGLVIGTLGGGSDLLAAWRTHLLMVTDPDNRGREFDTRHAVCVVPWDPVAAELRRQSRHNLSRW